MFHVALMVCSAARFAGVSAAGVFLLYSGGMAADVSEHTVVSRLPFRPLDCLPVSQTSK